MSSSIYEGEWTADDANVVLGGLPIAVTNRAGAAETMCRVAVARRGRGGRPRFVTSANGQVLAMCEHDPELRALFLGADTIHADGMPMVFASHLFTRRPLPERVATTDLIHDVMAIAPRAGIRSFLLGGRPETNAAAVATLRRLYPEVPEIVGHHGYFDATEERDLVERIDRFAPDILWVGLGVPKEQQFATRHLDRLTHVGVIKTCGGLFDFLSGDRPRAPMLLQRIGMEWAWRAMLEPKRLGKRYLQTNLAALRVLITRSS